VPVQNSGSLRSMAGTSIIRLQERWLGTTTCPCLVRVYCHSTFGQESSFCPDVRTLPTILKCANKLHAHSCPFSSPGVPVHSQFQFAVWSVIFPLYHVCWSPRCALRATVATFLFVISPCPVHIMCAGQLVGHCVLLS